MEPPPAGSKIVQQKGFDSHLAPKPETMVQQTLKQTLVLSFALASVSLMGVSLPSRAQSDGPSSVRAVNIARMTAEKLNGGLQVYRAGACMHQQSGGACLIRLSNDGYLFRFYGGGPGWQQLGQPPTLETEILVAPDGRSIRAVLYNGPIRSPGERMP